MTPEEKVALLKEAGVWDVIGYPTCIDKLFDLVAAHERERVMNEPLTKEMWDSFESEIRADEREACAKVCETDELYCKCGDECAAAIRARGDHG